MSESPRVMSNDEIFLSRLIRHSSSRAGFRPVKVN